MLILRLRACVIDLGSGRILREGRSTRLSRLERDLIVYLLARDGQPVSRRELLVEVWRYNPAIYSRAVDHTIKRLRIKLEVDPHRPDHLKTVYGVGYGFELPGFEASAAPGEAPVSAPYRKGREQSMR